MIHKYLEELYPTIEIINSKFSCNAGEWALKYSSLNGDLGLIEQFELEDMKEIDLSDRNFFEMKDHSIFNRLVNCERIKANGMAFDTFGQADRFIQICRDMNSLRFLEMDYYLLDLFWEIKERIKTLNPNIKYINGYDLGFAKPTEKDQEIDQTIKYIWKLANTYRLAQKTLTHDENTPPSIQSKQDSLPVWYIMDEVGLSINHCKDPNFVCYPFIYFTENIDKEVVCTTYNLIWPIKDIANGDFITRNYTLGHEEQTKMAKEGVWENIPIEPFIEAHDSFTKKMKSKAQEQSALFDKYNFASHEKIPAIELKPGQKFKIVTDYKCIKENMPKTNSCYQIVEDLVDADMCYFAQPLKSYMTEEIKELIESKMVNQFPYEMAFTSKSKLSETVQDVLGYTKWLPLTFSLSTQIDEFVGEFIHNKTLGDSNWWITKPTILSGSMDMAINQNLDLCLRQSETGTKIVSKYIDNPLRFRGSKFEIRQYVFVRSFEPLEIYIYKDFYTRMAKNDYTLDKRRLFQYDTHFTAYCAVSDRRVSKDFIPEFNQKNEIKYEAVYERIKQALRELFIAVKEKYPGLKSDQCRALYGVDIMVDANYNPKILEMNFSPDINPAVLYFKTFVKDMFDCFIFGEESKVDRIL